MCSTAAGNIKRKTVLTFEEPSANFITIPKECFCANASFFILKLSIASLQLILLPLFTGAVDYPQLDLVL